MNMRLCKKCNRELPIEEFRRGHSPCRQCEREAARLYRQTGGYKNAQEKYRSSPKGIATTGAREERPDIKAVRLAYALSEAGKERQRHYARSEKGKKNARKRQRKYRNTPKGRKATRARGRKRDNTFRWQQRRAKQFLTPEDIRLTKKEWKEIQGRNNHRCHYCGKKAPLTIDHVIPLSQGGSHSKENIVPACQSCNSSKGARMWRLC